MKQAPRKPTILGWPFYLMHMNWYTFLFRSQKKKTAVIMLKIPGATLQQLVTQASTHLWTVHPWSTILLNIKFKYSCIFNLNPSQTSLADQCPCSIRHISSWIIQKLGSEVWILLKAWLYFLRCSEQGLVVDGRIFRELLSAGYGLLPGRLLGSGGYLGSEVSMAVSLRPCRNERRKNLYGANDSVCSSTSKFINYWRSAAKLWTCRKHCASLV